MGEPAGDPVNRYSTEKVEMQLEGVQPIKVRGEYGQPE
jgi:hypothetical protein